MRGIGKNELYYKNYTDTSSKQLSFTQKERKYIAAVQSGEKTITAAAQPDRDPYSYVEDEKLTGIIPEYFAYLMDMAGLPYTQAVPKDRKEYEKWGMIIIRTFLWTAVMEVQAIYALTLVL